MEVHWWFISSICAQLRSLWVRFAHQDLDNTKQEIKQNLHNFGFLRKSKQNRSILPYFPLFRFQQITHRTDPDYRRQDYWTFPVMEGIYYLSKRVNSHWHRTNLNCLSPLYQHVPIVNPAVQSSNSKPYLLAATQCGQCITALPTLEIQLDCGKR